MFQGVRKVLGYLIGVCCKGGKSTVPITEPNNEAAKTKRLIESYSKWAQAVINSGAHQIPTEIKDMVLGSTLENVQRIESKPFYKLAKELYVLPFDLGKSVNSLLAKYEDALERKSRKEINPTNVTSVIFIKQLDLGGGAPVLTDKDFVRLGSEIADFLYPQEEGQRQNIEISSLGNFKAYRGQIEYFLSSALNNAGLDSVGEWSIDLGARRNLRDGCNAIVIALEEPNKLKIGLVQVPTAFGYVTN